MASKLTPFLLEHAAWSLSKVETAKQCPRKFWYTYINKPNKAALGIVESTDARTGKAIHRVLELIIKGHPLDFAIKTVIREKNLLTKEIESVEASRPAATKFLKTFNAFRHANGEHELITEAQVAAGFRGEKKPYFEKRGAPNTLLLRGMIDVGCIFKDKPTAIIIDHKTGKNKGIANHAHQMDCYALLIKANYPHVTKMLPAIHWVQDQLIEHGDPINLTDLDALVEKVVQFMLDATIEVDGSNLEKTKTSILCNWCDYCSLCPAQAATESLGGAHGEVKEESVIERIEGLNT